MKIGPIKLEGPALHLTVAAVVLAGIAGFGYWRYRTTAVLTPPAATKALDGDQIILARVGDTTITAFDLNLAATKGFTRETRARVLEGEQRKNFLESLIQARAMAVVSEKELSAEEKLEFARMAERHREELLVKWYLMKYGKLAEPSEQEIRDYYAAHLGEFGGAPTRTYEIIMTEQRLSGAARDALLKELARARVEPDWLAWAQDLKKKGHFVNHRRGELALSAMKAQLANIAEKLKPGESSEVTMIEGRPHVVRLISETKGVVKPIESVAAEIKERLAPVVLSRGAKTAAAVAMKQVEVVRY